MFFSPRSRKHHVLHSVHVRYLYVVLVGFTVYFPLFIVEIVVRLVRKPILFCSSPLSKSMFMILRSICFFVQINPLLRSEFFSIVHD
ncbi:hypothetical protein AR158_c541R [Paramecium bursaria Chlorella virus AR158]|uniref:hypothetical protein n=1 Tax=Paramecium bursaria Chlorella virus AR158 TaxID=380598 RepID=UPI00015AA75A|nr:hypothetical protein AR158_c541R [Paramecium bursaria Chlorella virus AR158]ABU44086.1 hypothetical protein AR158_c541R [Paramecium bursaria Chlorella virus AR158]